ncbi:nucleotidyltransferase family protein [Kitasatospora sp. NPDC049285]|uniref:nucleotidyltransferase family protein n=1 Tax=Kitasatospora sp. NPDC049285 TaxID=3157096 RepID=UPI0034201388
MSTTSADPYEALLAFGLLQPARQRTEMLAALAEVGPAAAADLLFRHKISTMARATALRLADQGGEHRELLVELADRITARAAVMADRWASSAAVGAAVTRFAEEEGITWWTMKGFSFRPLYPAGTVRDVGDLDVLVGTVDDAWRLARRLRADGYIYLDIELPWFKRDLRTGELYGQIRLTTAERNRLSIDIHAGPYSVRHCGLMPLGRTAGGGGTPGGPVAFEDDIAAVVANAAGDRFITAKAVNDLLLSLDRAPDARYLHETLDAAGLLPFLATCLGRVTAWCELTADQAQALAALLPDVAAEPVPPVDRADPAERCEITVAHARETALRVLGLPPERADAVAASAREAYGKDHPLQVVPDAEAQPVDWAGLNNWTCVRLVPVELAAALVEPGAAAASAGRGEASALSEEMVREETGGGTLIRAIGDSFVPTVDFALPAGLVAAAARG